MPLTTKIVLSDKELSAIQDKDWILTKLSALNKVSGILNNSIGDIDACILPVLKQHELMPDRAPRIYKGENYQGFPYLTLDHPGIFNKENVFAIRTMCWWGNFISITLHVSGAFKDIFGSRILQNMLQERDMYVCVNTDQWQHHFEAGNYQPVSEISAEQIEYMRKHIPFIKTALRYDLRDLNSISEQLNEGYKKMAKILT